MASSVWFAADTARSGEMARRIREKYNLRDYPVIYAYGDTTEDQEMLNIANRKYFRWLEMPTD